MPRVPLQTIIDVQGLGKQFTVRRPAHGVWENLKAFVRPQTETKTAVEGVSFQLQEGERVAFVGPNGAGKSTTIKMLTGILHPTAGQAQVAGLVPWQNRQQLAYAIGTVFGQRSQLWYHLPASDTFELLSRMYAIPRDVYQERRTRLVEEFQIGDFISTPVRQLSLGQRMRCEIVASLLHNPRILFLDEPTIGLDINAKAIIRDLIHRRSREDGTTVLLTSHDTGDMERVCDRVIVINEGSLILDTPVRKLRSTYIRKKLVTLVTKEEEISLNLPGVEVITQEPHRLQLSVNVATTPVEQVVTTALEIARVQDITIEDPPMEEVIKHIYKKPPKDSKAATGKARK